jgi:chloramphenicol-sensitive protein RarD
MKKKSYFIAACACFFVWGFFGLALKPLQDYAALDILFYRVFFSAGLLWVIHLLFRRKIVLENYKFLRQKPRRERQKILFLIFGGAILLAANWLLFIFVMTHVGIKVGAFAYLICPIITTVLAYFLLKEKINNWQWLAVFLCFIACTLQSFSHFDDIFYAVAVASSYALYLISQRKNNDLDKLLVLTLQISFLALLLLPFYFNFSGKIPQEALFYECLAAIVVLFTIIPLFLNLYALKGLKSATVGMLMYINPLINFIIAVFYYKETISYLQFTSYILILISIVVFNKKIFFDSKK